MKKKSHYIIVLSTIFFSCLFSCNTNDKKQAEELLEENRDKSGYSLDITDIAWSDFADSIFVRGKIHDKNDQKVFWQEIEPSEITVLYDKTRMLKKDVRIINRSKGYISDNIVVSFVIDKNVSSDNMEKIRKDVSFLLKNLPNHVTYISFFDNTIGESFPINELSFNDFIGEFEATKNHKIIFDATLKKMQELAGGGDDSFNKDIVSKAADEYTKKYMILFTDGMVDVTNPNIASNINAFQEFVYNLDHEQANKNQIEVDVLHYGKANPLVENTLTFICRDTRNENVKGGYYLAQPDSVLANIRRFSTPSLPDYEIMLKNYSGRVYFGKKSDYIIQIEKENQKAIGEKTYVIGSLVNPLVTGSDNKWMLIVTILIWGIILVVLSYLTVQIILPFIISKLSFFEKKYVKKFQSKEGELVKCYSCHADLIDGEDVVVKCKHITHKYCWDENGHKCVEYWQNCKDGIQYYFDHNNLFSLDKSPLYLKPLLLGMTGGLLSWLVYQLFVFTDPYILKPLSNLLLNIFYTGDIGNLSSIEKLAFFIKTGPLLLLGFMLGLVITFIFLYINNNQRGMTTGIRSLLGAAGGFMSFLIGSIIIYASKAYSTNIWIDWIPWAMLGVVIYLCTTYKNDFCLKTCVKCMILGVFTFFFLIFSGEWLGYYAVLISFMLIGGGIGVSTIKINSVKKYFLRYEINSKEINIAIHKWMDDIGGNNDVTIGRSNKAIIQMTWDESQNIKDIQAKVYIDKKIKKPFVKVLEDDILHNGAVLKKNDEFVLSNGEKFTIGNTEFEYFEK